MSRTQMESFEGEPWNLGAYQLHGGWTIVVAEARNTERTFNNYHDLLAWAEGIA